jgi:DinB superfamily
MKLLLSTLLLFTSTISAYAADANKASISQMQDRALSGIEREWVSLAEAMPADKYNFAPTQGSFDGVRTFEQQVAHVGAVLYVVSSGIIGEKAPTAAGSSENGPSSLKTKDDFVNYLKGAFAYAHKAMGTLTDQNFTEMVPSPFGGKNKMPKGSLAELTVAHSFDHYGQSVVYARMNNIVPPASRK